jgi:hypothetical protein
MVTDSLQSFIGNTIPACHQLVLLPPQAIQYTDYTVLIMEAHATTLKIVAKVLQDYADITGLKINSVKSMFVPLSISQELTPVVGAILNCQQASFPMTFLGLLLTTRKPSKLAFQPIIKAVQNTLEGWQGNILSYMVVG